MTLLGSLGFSYSGLMMLLMLTIPNLFWRKHQPRDYDPSGENRTLLLLERLGQVLTTCSLLFFRDTNPGPWSAWSIWLLLALLLMLLYEYCWLRYFRGQPTNRSFYRSLGPLPVPLATLPVTAALLLGVYGRLLWLILAALILGVGHIGIHLQHLRELA